MDAVTIIDLTGDDCSTSVPYTADVVPAPNHAEDDLELWLEHTRWYDLEHRTRVLEGLKKLKAIDKKWAAPEQPWGDAVFEEEQRTKALVAVEASGVSYSPVAAYTNSPCLKPRVVDDTLPSPPSPSPPQAVGGVPQTPESRGRTLNRDGASHPRDPSPLSLAWIMEKYPISPPSSPMRGRSRSPSGFRSPWSSPPPYRSRSPVLSAGRPLYTARRSKPRLFASRKRVE